MNICMHVVKQNRLAITETKAIKRQRVKLQHMVNNSAYYIILKTLTR